MNNQLVIILTVPLCVLTYFIGLWLGDTIWRLTQRKKERTKDEPKPLKVRLYGKRKVGITVAGDKAVNCFYCDGAGCKFCSGRGWIPKDGP